MEPLLRAEDLIKDVAAQSPHVELIPVKPCSAMPDFADWRERSRSHQDRRKLPQLQKFTLMMIQKKWALGIINQLQLLPPLQRSPQLLFLPSGFPNQRLNNFLAFSVACFDNESVEQWSNEAIYSAIILIFFGSLFVPLSFFLYGSGLRNGESVSKTSISSGIVLINSCFSL